MLIRLVRPEDAEHGLLKTLANLASLDGLDPASARRIISGLSQKKNAYRIFVAEVNGDIVGTTTLLIEQKLIHGGGKVGHIEDVAVRQGFAGSGIGSALVERAVEEAKREGCYKVILDCDYALIPFYMRLGFHKRGVYMRIDL